MSAIVTESVPRWRGPAVLSGMLKISSSGNCEESIVLAPRARRGGAGGYLPGALLVCQVGEEQRLVDSALEDRHAQLHALLDDLATFHSGFASELRGREMDCHQSD